MCGKGSLLFEKLLSYQGCQPTPSAVSALALRRMKEGPVMKFRSSEHARLVSRRRREIPGCFRPKLAFNRATRAVPCIWAGREIRPSGYLQADSTCLVVVLTILDTAGRIHVPHFRRRRL